MKTTCSFAIRTAALLLAALFTLPFLSSCVTNASSTSAPFHTTRVINSVCIEKVGEYGQYLYAGDHVLYRYDRQTGEMRRACLDPECDGGCPLESGYAHVAQIADGKLYFCTWYYQDPSDVNFDMSTAYGYQDLSTGEVTVLAEVPWEDSDEGTPVFVYDGMLYYTRYTLKEDLDPDARRSGERNKEYHDHWLCRVPITGGEEERLRRTEEIISDRGRQDERYFMIADGYYLTRTADGRILSYDRDFKESTVLLDMAALGFTFGKAQYLDGKLYGLLHEGADPAANPPYLASIDLAAKEIRRLTDMYVYGFAVTEDAIYYEPYLGSTLYIPENNEKQSELAPDERDWGQIVNVPNGRTVHVCAHDGTGDRIVFTSGYQQFLQGFTVVDGVLYAWLFGEKSLAEPARFCAVDLASGTVTPAIWTEK